MTDPGDSLSDFLRQLWSLATAKHDQGLYNSVCLAVLLALPALVLLTALVVCCHCCCRCRGCGGAGGAANARSKKKKGGGGKDEDLWISVTAGPMTPDRVALTMV